MSENLFDKCSSHPLFGKPVRVSWWDAWDSTGDWERLGQMQHWKEVCDSWTHEECGIFLGQDEFFIFTCQLLNLISQEVRNISAIPTYSITKISVFEDGKDITDQVKRGGV